MAGGARAGSAVRSRHQCWDRCALSGRQVRWPAVGSAVRPTGPPGRSVATLSCQPGRHRRMPAPRILGNTGPMGDDSGRRGRAIRLTDRLGERGVLDQLIDAVRAGGSGVLVVRGEPGVGKSVLLDYLAGRASGCRPATRAMCCCLSCWRCSLVISGLPSRLYGAYQREWVFSSLTPTMIFAVYALAALLVVGRLSDSIGRKPESARRRKASRAGRMPVPRGRIQGRSGGLHGPVTATTMRAWSLPCSWSPVADAQRQLLAIWWLVGHKGWAPAALPRRWSSAPSQGGPAGWCFLAGAVGMVVVTRYSAPHPGG